MTIPVSSLFTPKTPSQWLQQTLTDAQAQGLSSTSWQAGDPILTVLAILAEELAREDSMGISLRAQGGFLDFAATGSVTITDDLVTPTTTLVVPVTPDPSIPAQNPTGAPGLLDTLASSVYNVKRIQATAAVNPLYLANTSGVSLGTFQPGTFHVQNVFTGATYSNQSAFTFTPSTVIGTSIVSVAGPAPVTVTTLSNHGLTTGMIVYAQSLGIVADNFYSVTVTGFTTFTLAGASIIGTFPGPTPPGPNVWTSTPITFAADQLGTYGNAGVLAINQLITAAPKCFCGNMQTFAGTPWQSNSSLAALCRAKLATIGVGGPPGAYKAFALLAQNILTGQAVNPQGLVLTNPLPSNVTLDGGAINRALVTQNPSNGAVTVVIAAAGTTSGFMNLQITGATTASPIVITTAANHGALTGDFVQVNGVQGLVGANGTWVATRINATQLSLNGSSGAGTYTASTGQISTGDVYAVSTVLAAYVEPQAVSLFVQAATPLTLTITALVTVPKAFTSDYTSKMTAALTAYFTTFPIGGVNVDFVSNVIPAGAVEGILYAAGQTSGQIYTISVAFLTLNGLGFGFDLAIGTTTAVQLGSLAGIIVVGQ